ncbi:MAG: 30S ribosomal protein S6 [Bacteroidetes bacterium]|jgi:small subunit ribosomal protein S6|nr:30S ribosomal protein S6 [Bacteroidota bacterium]
MASSTSTYELTYIINPVLNDDRTQDIIRRVNKYIEEHGGELLEVDEWGSRRMAYQIDKKRNGYYINLYFEADGSLIQPLERALQIEDNILRYLTLKMDAKMLRHYEEQKAARASVAE